MRRALIVVGLLGLAGPARANPSEALEQARDNVRNEKWTQARDRLVPLLYPNLQLADTDEIAEAHVMLGVAYFKLGDPEQAAGEFEQALLIDGELSLDPDYYEKPVVDYFDHTKDELADKLAREAARRKAAQAAEEERQRQALRQEVVIEKSGYLLNFVPFGVGQFQNGQPGWGTFFAVSEGALGAASITLFSVQVLKYGWGGTVPRDDVDTVNKIQIVQVGTGALFAAFWAAGVVHSFRHYQPRRTITRPFGGPLPDDPPAATSSWRLAPILGPDTAGLAFSWEL